jgi:hypothetical protein
MQLLAIWVIRCGIAVVNVDFIPKTETELTQTHKRPLECEWHLRGLKRSYARASKLDSEVPLTQVIGRMYIYIHVDMHNNQFFYHLTRVLVLEVSLDEVQVECNSM